MTTEVFPAKVLLFGEYTVLQGGSALAMPYSRFLGRWTKDGPPREQFSEWLEYLFAKKEMIADIIDVGAFANDLQQGWIYDADIPIGQGLGSSAALTASVYARYQHSIREDCDYKTIRLHLALIESYFHGSSSGFDPLISFLRKTVLCQADGSLLEVELAHQDEVGVYIILTDVKRHTEDLVSDYQRRCGEKVFYQRMEDLRAINDDALLQFVRGKDYWPLLCKVSEVQYQYLNHLIVPELLDVWQSGLEHHQWLLKLCGAGGGGAYLLFAKEVPKMPSHSRLFKLL